VRIKLNQIFSPYCLRSYLLQASQEFRNLC